MINGYPTNPYNLDPWGLGCFGLEVIFCENSFYARWQSPFGWWDVCLPVWICHFHSTFFRCLCLLLKIIGSGMRWLLTFHRKKQMLTWTIWPQQSSEIQAHPWEWPPAGGSERLTWWCFVLIRGLWHSKSASQCNMDQLKMYFLLIIGIVQLY